MTVLRSHQGWQVSRRTIVPAICLVALFSVAQVLATTDEQPGHLPCTEHAEPTAADLNLPRPDPVCALRVTKIRFEEPPPDALFPSALLKFDVINLGLTRIADVELEVTIRERLSRSNAPVDRRTIVGPFTIRGRVAIEAGYTFNYNLILRNFSSDCECIADVSVVGARWLPNPR
jgi:hypothetical protein